MAEYNPDTDTTPVNDGDLDWFTSWLEHGTVAQRSVPIYGRPDLFAKYEDLERQRKIAEEIEEAGEKAMGDPGTEAIDTQLRALYDQWQASKATWYIRALSSDEIDDVRDSIAFPTEPGSKATDEEKRAYEKAEEEANSKANLEMISRALVKIENPKGDTVKDSITSGELTVMRSKLGDQQIMRLVAAAMVAMSEDVELPVPFSRNSSEDDQM